jgi:hypothetical protein
MAFLGFGSSPSLNTNSTQPYVSAINSIASGLGSQGQAAQTQYGGFNQRDVDALNNLSNYYTSNPATQQYNAAQTANAEQAARVGSARATAQLDENLAARGISPNSSIGVGGLASIANQQASTNANIQAQQGLNNEEMHAANLARNADLWNGATGTAFGRANTLQNQQAQLEQEGFSDADQLAMQQYQVQQQQQQADDAFAGQLFGAGAGLFAPGAVFGKSLFPAAKAAAGAK